MSLISLAKLDPIHNQGPALALEHVHVHWFVESLYVEAHKPPLEIRKRKIALQ